MPGLRGCSARYQASWSSRSDAGAIAILQVDDFQDGTTQNLERGEPANSDPPRTSRTSGRPEQANALLITGSGGFGAGANLVALNPCPSRALRSGPATTPARASR